MLTTQPGQTAESEHASTSSLTVHELLTTFDRLHVSQLKDPGPTRSKLKVYFNSLRPLALESLTVPIVLEWYNTNRQRSQVQADSCVSMLRTAINRAISWEMFKGTNVAKLVKRKAFPRRKRYIMKGERPALINEIDRESLMVRVYFYLLYYVAPRPGEVQRIKLEDLKLFKSGEGFVGVWIKPTTKNGDVQQVPLPSFVCELLITYLATLPADQTDLFRGRGKKRPLSNEAWQRQWTEIRRRAGLGDVQMRDLRRTCATDLTPHLDLVTISKGVLNHRDLNTTQIYVQPISERIIDAMNANVLTNRAHLTPIRSQVPPVDPIQPPERHPLIHPALLEPQVRTIDWPG